MKIAPFGEGAIYLDLEIEGAPNRAARTLAAAAALRAAMPGADIAVGAGSILLVGEASEEEARSIALPALSGAPRDLDKPRVEWIKAVCGGPDLGSSGEALGSRAGARV